MSLIPAKNLGDDRIVLVLLESDVQKIAQEELGRKCNEKELDKIQDRMESWLGQDWWEEIREGIRELVPADENISRSPNEKETKEK